MGQNVHGSKAGALLDGRDLTRYTTDFNFATDIDMAEQTCLMADGGAKEYLYGNAGSSAGLDGRLAKSRPQLEREIAALRGQEEGAKLFLQAPAGFGAGRPCIMFQTLKEKLSVKGGMSNVNGTGMSFIADGVARVGSMLLAPRVTGGANVSRDEIQTLAFASADPNQFFGLRATGTAQAWQFQLSSFATDAALAAAVKAGIEGLAAYAGRTATVTVLTPRSGTGALSLALQVVFDGATNVAQLEAVSGAVDAFVVTNGNSGNYSINGGANFTLPITEGALQVNLRNLGGQFAGVVVKGSSAGATLLTLQKGATRAVVYDGNVCPTTNADPAYASWQIKQGNTVVAYHNPGTGDNAGGWNCNSDAQAGLDQITVPAAAADGTYIALVSDHGVCKSLTFNVGTGYAPAVPASASFKLYYSLTATPAAPTVTGTGATNARQIAKGDAPTSLTGATMQEGGTFSGLNLIAAPTTFPSVKTADAATATGATIDLHATFVSTGALSVPVLVEHSANGTTGWATLATFVTLSDATNRAQLAQRIVLPSGTQVQPFLRVRVPTLTGSVALGVALARKPS